MLPFAPKPREVFATLAWDSRTDLCWIVDPSQVTARNQGPARKQGITSDLLEAARLAKSVSAGKHAAVFTDSSSSFDYRLPEGQMTVKRICAFIISHVS